MGTRGLWGFVVDGQEKLTYNHCDSYPGGLGTYVLNALRGIPLDELRQKASSLRLVTHDDSPTPGDVENLRPWTNLNVGNQSESDWYCLLREAQGSIGATLDAGYMLSAGEFYADSLFCEWGYVVDLDTEVFEVYEGFQHDDHHTGRFAERVDEKRRADGYYPIKLVASFPLSALPDDLSVIEGDDEDAD